jgi:hypothetical protein
MSFTKELQHLVNVSLLASSYTSSSPHLQAPSMFSWLLSVSNLLDVEGMYPGHARSQIITKDYKGTQRIGIMMRANSGELSRCPSCYKARRIDDDEMISIM